MKYKYFFFDFDGMLADTYAHTTTAFVKAMDELRGKGSVNYKEAYDLLKISFGACYEHYKVNKEEDELFSKYHFDINFEPKGTLYLPIKNMLKNIVDNGGKVFIYTNRGETSLVEYLKLFGIYDLFTDIICSANKPDPTPLLNMIKKHNLDIKDCVVVGDRSLDVNGAYNAKVDGILYDVDSRVFDHKATHVIKRLNELYNFINYPNYLKANYHTHTIRCGHAFGEDEQYIQEAIKAGLQVLGFSDHIMIPDIKRNYEYFETLALLKEKYKDQIEIKIGLEVEYMEYYLPFYKKLKDEKLVDYLILGNHGYCDANGKSRDDINWFMEAPVSVEELDIYYDNLIKAYNTGLFKYIAHPDIFLKGYQKWDEHTIALAHKIAKFLQDNDLYAEYNVQGYRCRTKMEYNGQMIPCYPFDGFFEILKQYNIKYVFGLDAHGYTQFNEDSLTIALNKAHKLQLDCINFNDTINDL